MYLIYGIMLYKYINNYLFINNIFYINIQILTKKFWINRNQNKIINKIKYKSTDNNIL